MTREQYVKNRMEQVRTWEQNLSFVNHAATLTRFSDDVFAIDWRNKNGSNFYYVRYFADGDKLYISGDLGEAVFERGGAPVTEWFFENPDYSYLLAKQACSSEGDCGEYRQYEFCDKVWKSDLNDWINERKEDITYFGDEQERNAKLAELEKTVEIIKGIEDECPRAYETEVLHNAELLAKFEFEELEEISGFGQVIPARLIYWVEGLNMALEQLGMLKKAEGARMKQ